MREIAKWYEKSLKEDFYIVLRIWMSVEIQVVFLFSPYCTCVPHYFNVFWCFAAIGEKKNWKTLQEKKALVRKRLIHS